MTHFNAIRPPTMNNPAQPSLQELIQERDRLRRENAELAAARERNLNTITFLHNEIEALEAALKKCIEASNDCLPMSPDAKRVDIPYYAVKLRAISDVAQEAQKCLETERPMETALRDLLAPTLHILEQCHELLCQHLPEGQGPEIENELARLRALVNEGQ